MHIRLVILLALFVSAAFPGSLRAEATSHEDTAGNDHQLVRQSFAPQVQSSLSDAWFAKASDQTRDTQAVIGVDDRERVSPAFSPVAVVASLYPDGTESSCTGTFIGPTVLVTAAHCLHSWANGGWPQDILVIPGMDGSDTPFGYYFAIDAFVPTGWVESTQSPDFETAHWDYAVVILDASIGNETGWMSVGNLSTSLLQAPDFSPVTIGYPGDKPIGTQWFAAAPAFTSVMSEFLTHEIDSFSGQSGSAVMRFADGAIVGIVSFHQGNGGTLENVARRINAQVIDFITDACIDVGCSFSSFTETEPLPPTPEPPTQPPPPPATPEPPSQPTPVPPSSPPASSTAFQHTWARTDQPVALGQANRTWMWGPKEFVAALSEPYLEAPGGARTVQYFDKSRMEITNPAGDPNSIWYVTNGLLVNELMTGRLQLGDNTFVQYQPAQVNVAGDADDATGPTYATFAHAIGAAPLPEGSVITQRIDRQGNVNFDPGLTSENVTAARYVPETNHTVASVFWDFMNSEGLVFDGGSTVWAPLFVNPFYATGYPVTEAYWASVKVGGVYRNVLIQVFERRVLTYTPGNGPGWEVEAGNVGQHYYQWRYDHIPSQ